MNNNVATAVTLRQTLPKLEGLAFSEIVEKNLYGFFKLVAGSKDHGVVYFRHIRRRTMITPINIPHARVTVHPDARFIHLKNVEITIKE